MKNESKVYRGNHSHREEIFYTYCVAPERKKWRRPIDWDEVGARVLNGINCVIGTISVVGVVALFFR